MEPLKQDLEKITSNLGLVTTGSVRLESGELELAGAIAEKKIYQRPQEDLTQVLRLIMARLGIRANNLPSPAETAILRAHILKSYGNHTCEEIVLAFEMALDGRLDLAERDVSCYENFSCLYFSRIMNSYRRWACQEYRQLERKLVPQLEYKESVNDEGMQEWLNQVILQVVNEKYEPEFLPYQLYDWLLARGKITPTPEEITTAIHCAMARRELFLIYEQNQQDDQARREALAEFRKMKGRGYFTGQEMLTVDSLAKKILLHAAILKTPVE